jgi:surface antigen
VDTQAGSPMNAPYVPSLHTQLQQEGKWKGQSNPQPGDIVIFDWEGKGEAWHVGLVKGVNADGSIQTIEGNTSQPGGGPQGVWEKTRYMSTVLGFANP